jgi:hypothetical protein
VEITLGLINVLSSDMAFFFPPEPGMIEKITRLQSLRKIRMQEPRDQILHRLAAVVRIFQCGGDAVVQDSLVSSFGLTQGFWQRRLLIVSSLGNSGSRAFTSFCGLLPNALRSTGRQTTRTRRW